jgi:hypothetical protein
MRYLLTRAAAALGMFAGTAHAAEPPTAAEMAGYLLVPHSRVDESYDGGFSMYVAAWPLLKDYPGSKFQTGLFGTWMHADYKAKAGEKHYSDIEGGLGWWRDTRFATETPKFIMGGVALNFSEWANGPGAGKGRNWQKPAGQYAIAQLSPNLLWPPDGLNLKQGTSGELFGYGYLPLPLAEKKSTTAGKPVPTGDQCWTLFINSRNFKGPATFFLPYFWTKPTVADPLLAGTFLDARGSNPNKAVQMETQYIPALTAKDQSGQIYAKIAPTRFPVDSEGRSAVVHKMLAYKRSALWDGVKKWFDGGPVVEGAIPGAATAEQRFESKGGSTWKLYPLNAKKEQRIALDWNSFANPLALDGSTYGYRWKPELVAKSGGLATLPEYYRFQRTGTKELWVVVSEKDVPAETGLAQATFPRPKGPVQEAYETPEDAKSSWKVPGPAAGPFTATLGDGSIVTYYWYRFADQPALLNADMTAEERERMQKRVELLHRHWTKEKEYLPKPATGNLADLDPALLVVPPKGFEIGYVPIVTRQAGK